MKNLTNEQKLYIMVGSIIILTLSTIFLIISNSYKNNELKEQDRKTGEIERNYERRLESAQQQSQIERLGSAAEENRKAAEQNLEDIKKSQKDYEFNTLVYRCYKDQVNRLIENKEIDEQYCFIDSNLEQFRLKK